MIIKSLNKYCSLQLAENMGHTLQIAQKSFDEMYKSQSPLFSTLESIEILSEVIDSNLASISSDISNIVKNILLRLKTVFSLKSTSQSKKAVYICYSILTNLCAYLNQVGLNNEGP